MKKSLRYVIGTTGLFVFCWLIFSIYFLFFPISKLTTPETYLLKPRASKKAVLEDLKARDLIKYPLLLSLYTYTQSDASLKTGEYLFSPGATPLSIWRQLTTGRGQVYYPFTIIPGWTFKQVRLALDRSTNIQHVATQDDKTLMQQLVQLNVSPEGQFLPETYYYTRGSADVDLLKRAYKQMQKKLKAEWDTRGSVLPYANEYQALIAASLIEKEAYLSTERPIIAGVLVNRLRANMLLQFDPTIIYGLGESYDGKIHKHDLIKDTPYNTYLRKGLPPTPIAMPSAASIEAALHPETHQYYYFVAKGNGAHQFSRDLLEHHVAVSEARQHVPYFNETRIKAYLQAYFFKS